MGTAALLTYHAQLGDLDKVFELVQGLNTQKSQLQPSICADLVRACAAKGDEGRALFLNQAALWRTHRVKWWPLISHTPALYSTVLSFLDTAPGSGPALNPAQMVRQMEALGLQMSKSFSWIALLQYFSIVRKDLVHVEEILAASAPKGLRCRPGDLDPALDLLLAHDRIEQVYEALKTRTLKPAARFQCCAQVFEYHLLQRNDLHAAQDYLQFVQDDEGPAPLLFHTRVLALAVQRRKIPVKQIFETVLPSLGVSSEGYPVQEVLEHSFAHYFNLHQYKDAVVLLEDAVQFYLNSSRFVPTPLIKLFVSIALRHLPDRAMELEVEDLLRRLALSPNDRLGPAVVKPFLSVSAYLGVFGQTLHSYLFLLPR